MTYSQDRMILEKRRLGRTGLMVTELGLGAMNLPDVSEGEETIRRALELGINFIDTARVYRGSEYLIGRVVEERGKDFYIASKTTSRIRDGALNDIARSLGYLHIERIDLYQLHDVRENDWDRAIGPGGALEGLREAREQGMIAHIGLSSHSVEILRRAIEYGEFETVLLMYNPFQMETADLPSLARRNDVGVIAMKPFGGGGMLGGLRVSGHGDQFNAKTLLRYALSNPDISVVIPGARFPLEVEENVELARSYEPMSDDEARIFQNEAKTAL